MDVVYEWLIDEGYEADEIRDTSGSCPYDYQTGPEDNPSLRMEVKGLSGCLGPVEITDGELRSARDTVETALAVVHGIDVKVDEHGELIGSGGTLWVERPWKPASPT
jgi:hypothetical protein